jgi:hypothetical protein
MSYLCVSCSAAPLRASTFRGPSENFIRLAAHDPVPTEDERGNARHAYLCGLLPYRVDAAEATFRPQRPQGGLGCQSGAARDFSQVVLVFQVLSLSPMGAHSGVTKRHELPLVAGIFCDRQGTPGIGQALGKHQILYPERGRELMQAALQLRQPLRRNTLGNRPPPRRRFRVQLKPAPVNVYGIVLLQPDQAALLGNEAIRSHKVRIEPHHERPGVSRFWGFHRHAVSFHD